MGSWEGGLDNESRAKHVPTNALEKLAEFRRNTWKDPLKFTWERGMVDRAGRGAISWTDFVFEEEPVSERELVQVGHEAFEKRLAILLFFCNEAKALKHVGEEKVFPGLAVFGETGRILTRGNTEGDVSHLVLESDSEDARKILEEPRIKCFSRTLQLFHESVCFAERCQAAVENILIQLDALCTELNGHTVPLALAWTSLGDTLKLLITLDAVVESNSQISSALKDYKAVVAADGTQPALESFLAKLDDQLVSSKTFSKCIGADYDLKCEERGTGTSICSNRALLKDMIDHVRFSMKDLTAEWTAASQETESFPSYECESKLVGIAALFVLYTRVVPPKTGLDQSILKTLWQLQSSIPVVNLFGRAMWTLDAFLSEHVGIAITSIQRNLNPRDPAVYRKEYISLLVSSLQQRIPSYLRHVSLWCIQMDRQLVVSDQDSVDTVASALQRLLVHAVSLGHRARRILRITLGLHQTEQRPMPRKVLTRFLAVCIQLLKVIEAKCQEKAARIAQVLPLSVAQIKSEAFKELFIWKARLEAFTATGKVDESGLQDRAGAVKALHKILAGSQTFSFSRLQALRLVLAVASRKNDGVSLCRMDELIRFEKALEKLTVLCDFQSNLRSLCNCSLLYWQAHLFLPVILEDLVSSPNMPKTGVQWIVKAYSDASSLFFPFGAEDDVAAKTRVQLYRDSLKCAVETMFVLPICRAVEDTLRLHQHAVHMEFMRDKTHPRSKDMRKLRTFLALGSICVIGDSLEIKSSVESYLQRQFYDLTAVALHDWKTYSEMRKIAKECYGLVLEDSCLPQGALDTGLDVLQIMRRISVFASLFNYNMNQQFFIERKADRGAKHLKTIDVQSIADSISTHGLGIINTCVNFTYQYLAKAFEVFSEFLFDDNIRSYLALERRWFARHANDPDILNMYPFSRAFEYNRDIRRLGEPSPGVTYLTKFRQHLTKIGNALGYVRMVRSAGMHWVSEAVQFVPDLNRMPRFEAMKSSHVDSTEEDYAALDLESRRNLDTALSDLSRKFAEETNYLKVLVDAFRQVIESAQDTEHLDNFYMIIPSLCINFVEASLQAKDHLTRMHKGREAYFTDDGCAVGIAYFLCMLGQEGAFHSLHWFRGLQNSFDADIQKHNDRASALDPLKQKEKHQEATRRAKQLLTYKQEYQRLEFALSASLIFFAA